MATSEERQSLRSAISVLRQNYQVQVERAEQTRSLINDLYSYIGEEKSVLSHPFGNPGRYEDKALATAVREYLEMRGNAATVEDIVRGLEEGGFKFGALGWKKGEVVGLLGRELTKNSRAFQRTKSGSFSSRTRRKPKRSRTKHRPDPLVEVEMSSGAGGIEEGSEKVGDVKPGPDSTDTQS